MSTSVLQRINPPLLLQFVSDEPPDGGVGAGEGGPMLPGDLPPDRKVGDHLKIWLQIFVVEHAEEPVENHC